jgi:four helix bundle protein
MGDFKKLEVWRRAQKLAGTIYQLTNRFPSAERYGLSSQMRRAAVSVTANLAEGCGRQGDLELRRFVRISLGSLSELECELLLAADLTFLNRSHVRASAPIFVLFDVCCSACMKPFLQRVPNRLQDSGRRLHIDVFISTSSLRLTTKPSDPRPCAAPCDSVCIEPDNFRGRRS